MVWITRRWPTISPRRGISLEGISGPASPPGSTAQGETAIFAELGIAAGKSFPQADGILFLGGSTVNYPYLAEIQRETGKPSIQQYDGHVRLHAGMDRRQPRQKAVTGRTKCIA